MMKALFTGVGHLSADVRHLLKLLRAFEERFWLLICNHPATLKEQQKISLLDSLCKTYDLLEINEPGKFNYITSRLPYCDATVKGRKGKYWNWKTRVRKNQYLKQVLEYVNPRWRDKKKKYPKGARGMIKLARNAGQYIMKEFSSVKTEAAKKNKKGKKGTRIQRFKALEVNYMISQALPGMLCELEKLINDVGELEDCVGYSP